MGKAESVPPYVDAAPEKEISEVRKYDKPPRPKMREKPLPPAEKDRRAQIGKLHQDILQLDSQFFSGIRPQNIEHLQDTIDDLEAHEALAFGKENVLKQKKLGESVNAVLRCEFGNPPRVAFVKPNMGESFFRMNTSAGIVEQVQRTLNADTGEVEENVTDLDEDSQAILKSVFAGRQTIGGLKKSVAEYYGVEESEVPLEEDVLSARNGLEKESSVIHEYAVSRIERMLNLGVVPLTVVRAMPGNTDISSVQAGVESADPKNPARPMTRKLFKEVVDQGKNHPGAKSLMRIAALDYLVRTLDRHPNNIFYDPVSHQFTGIDNAASFGLSFKADIPDGKGGKRQVQGALDQYTSVAFDAIASDETWVLDDEAHASMKALYDNIVGYLAKRQKAKTGEFDLDEILDIEKALPANTGKEIKYISQLFRQMFKSEKIANKEALEFAGRLRDLVVHRRPPTKKMAIQKVSDKIDQMDVADE